MKDQRPFLSINYGINSVIRYGARKQIVHANHKLRLRGSWNDGDIDSRIRQRIHAMHPNWAITGYCPTPPKPKHPCHVFMVMPRFVRLIADRIKRTTVRLARKRMPLAGDYIDLRAWKGKPYRSKQRRVLLCQIDSVRSFHISAQGEFYVAGRKLSVEQTELCALRDGFAGPEYMVAFFHSTHGLPFTGFVTEWA